MESARFGFLGIKEGDEVGQFFISFFCVIEFDHKIMGFVMFSVNLDHKFEQREINLILFKGMNLAMKMVFSFIH